MLCVFNVWKVKSLQFQLRTTNRKRKVGENLFTEDQEDDEPVAKDWEAYMDRLQILLVAYAMGGTEAIPQGQGAAVQSDIALGADSSQFVMVPLDVVMAYWYRAKRTSSMLPMARRLEWVQTRDVAERAEWVSRFRESSSSLQAIIKEVMIARDAHWVAGVSALPTAEPVAAGATAPVIKAPQVSQFTLGKAVNGRSVARTMRDGTKLCAAFQQGQCKQKGPCPQGQHRCGVVTKKERICGSPGHGAHACRNSSKPWRGPGGDGEASPGSDRPTPPCMADLMAGPNAPLTKAFLFCGWSAITVDWLLDPSHDLANPQRQKSLRTQLQDVCFIAAALDCSTKSRAREIPRVFQDGRP